jgi:hypothetical protein
MGKLKITLFAVFLLATNLNAQKIDLTIAKNGIHFRKDSICVRIGVANKTKTTYALYSIEYANFDSRMKDDFKTSKFPYKNYHVPGLVLIVRNEKDQFCKMFRLENDLPFRDPRKKEAILKDIQRSRRNVRNRDKYHFLNPTDNFEFEIVKSLRPLELKKGKYNLQLIYFSNSWYQQDFETAKKASPNLKTCVLFQGLIKSDIYWFTLR